MSTFFGPRAFWQPIGTQTTNLITKSQDLSNAAWSDKTRITVTANAAVAPDGTVTASKISADTNNSTHLIGHQISSGLTALGTRSISIYAKPGTLEQTQFELTWYEGNFVGAYYRWFFDADRGEVYWAAPGTTDIVCRGSHVEQIGNGWMRCCATITDFSNGGSGSTSAWFYLTMVNSPNQGQGLGESYTGNNSYGMYFWGAQVENSSYVSPYVPNL